MAQTYQETKLGKGRYQYRGVELTLDSGRWTGEARFWTATVWRGARYEVVTGQTKKDVKAGVDRILGA